jgi:hypothetical protein
MNGTLGSEVRQTFSLIALMVGTIGSVVGIGLLGIHLLG